MSAAAYPEAEMVTAEMENSASKTSNAAAESPIVITPLPVTTASEVTTTNSTSAPRHQSVQVIEERQGQKCCGCCCDYRRAVIIVNVIIGILQAIFLIIVATRLYSYSSASVAQDGSEIARQSQIIEMIFSGVSIFLSALAIGGAYTYNIILLSLNVVWLVTAYVLGIFFSLDYCNDYCEVYYDDDFYPCTCVVSVPTLIVSGVVMCLFVYPHVGLIIEVRKGIMSRETYRREEFSCCCTA